MSNFISGDFLSRFNKTKTKAETDPSANAEKILDKFDKNNDGDVSIKEFKKSLGFNRHADKSIDEKFLNFDMDGDGNLSADEMEEFISIVDKNNDGKLSSSEKKAAANFLKYSSEDMELDKSTYDSANFLSKADKSKEGKISLSEFGNFFGIRGNVDKSLQEKFEGLDVDGDGNISAEEASEFTASVDKDGNGKMSYSEKMAAKNFLKYSSEDMIMDKSSVNAASVLAKADGNKDSAVTIAEFTRSLGFKRNDESIKEKISALDTNGDGNLTLNEVSGFISKIDKDASGKLSSEEKCEARNFVKTSEAIVADNKAVAEEVVEEKIATDEAQTNEDSAEANIDVETKPNLETQVLEEKTTTDEPKADVKVAPEVKPGFESIQKAASILSRLDSNFDSKVSYSELAQELGVYNQDEEFLQKISKFDKNMDGSLSVEEVANLIAKMDVDQDGTLSSAEKKTTESIFKYSDDPYSS